MRMSSIRRGLAATAVLGAIAAPSAMACHGSYTPPPTGDPAAPCATQASATGGKYYSRHFRGGRYGRTCTPTPPPVTPPPVNPPPVNPPPAL